MPGDTHRRDYRGDIDGLRAIAVLGVVAYHAFPGVVQGGFTGVDVFFVISGFLITQIIARELGGGSFSFVDFYSRRARRIFPALLIALAATLAIGWQTLFSSEFEQLGKHVAAGAAFVSNLVLQREAGYFDYDSGAKPLLHLWSLGVEEQFYLLWPLFLAATWRVTPRLDLALIAVVAISFIASVIASSTNPAAAFYFPIFRFWELACGGVLALTVAPAAGGSWIRGAAGIAGIGLIAIGMLAIDSRDLYPGWLALLPTAGACLIIAGGSGLANRLLAMRPLVAIGLISYPLYLWHWPLITFARILDGPLPSRELRLLLVVVSVILAALTYLLVERPIRASRSLQPTAARLLAAMVVVGGAGYAVFASGGAPFRTAAVIAEPFIATSQRSSRLAECIDIAGAGTRPDDWYCRLNPGGAPARTIVSGDSHAFALLPAFEAIARNIGEDVLFVSMSACPPLLGVSTGNAGGIESGCRALNERVFQLATDRQIDNVFLIGNWTYYTDGNYAGENLNVISFGDTPPTRDGSRAAFRRGVELTINRYAALPVTLHVVQKVPAQLRNSIDLIRDVVTGTAPADQIVEDISVPRETHRRQLQFVMSEFAALAPGSPAAGRVELVDLEEVYCGAEKCPFGRDGQSFYFDDNHLSVSGALLASPVLARHMTPHRPSARIP
jgi:peptidoglycan/LPS O-acetylase OafA/YrhL